MNTKSKMERREDYINYRLFIYKQYKDHFEMAVCGNYYKKYKESDFSAMSVELDKMYPIDDLIVQNIIESSKICNYKSKRGKHLYFNLQLREHALIKMKFFRNIAFTRLYNNLPYENIKHDNSLCDNYDDFLTRHSRRYKFLQSIKTHLKTVYYTKIETIYKRVYHPSNITELLQKGYDIDEAIALLDKKLICTYNMLV